MSDNTLVFGLAVLIALLWWLDRRGQRRGAHRNLPVNNGATTNPAPEPPRTLNQMADLVISRMKERTTP